MLWFMRADQLNGRHKYVIPVLLARLPIWCTVEDPKDGSIKQRLPALTARLNHKLADNFIVSARAMGHEKRINEDEKPHGV